MTKLEMKCFVRKQIAAIVDCMDLDQVLGTQVHEELCDDHTMLEYVEKCRAQVAQMIRGGQ